MQVMLFHTATNVVALTNIQVRHLHVHSVFVIDVMDTELLQTKKVKLRIAKKLSSEKTKVLKNTKKIRKIKSIRNTMDLVIN